VGCGGGDSAALKAERKASRQKMTEPGRLRGPWLGSLRRTAINLSASAVRASIFAWRSAPSIVGPLSEYHRPSQRP
jgi:hypothetical protein